MDAPKFKEGQMVFWTHNIEEESQYEFVEILLEPIADTKIWYGSWQQLSNTNQPFYVCKILASGRVELLGESVLTPWARWESCSGEHRQALSGRWEKKIERY